MAGSIDGQPVEAGLVQGNLYTGIPAALPQELVDILCQRSGLRIERIVSRGHCSPPGFWYDQPEHEFVLLLSGAARLEFAATDARGPQQVELSAADHLLIPAHQRHRVDWTPADADTVWLAVLFGDGAET
jgi:cupin 2 domain-containing protein